MERLQEIFIQKSNLIEEIKQYPSSNREALLKFLNKVKRE